MILKGREKKWGKSSMWKLSIFTAAIAMLSGCVTNTNPPLAEGVPAATPAEYNAPSYFAVSPENNPRKSYNWTTSNEQARVGLTSQRFELRHGDCGPDDCDRDRQRIEAGEDDYNKEAKVGEQRWYGWSIYLPPGFQGLGVDTPMVLGQGKLVRWRPALWDFTIVKNNFVFKHTPNGDYDPTDCLTGLNVKQMQGRWTDIVVFADYSTKKSGKPMVSTWVNGKLRCQFNEPLITQKMLDDTGKDQIMMKYGIYTAYVSEWLNRNKTKQVSAAGYTDVHVDAGGSNESITNTPFKFDWGVKLPTLIAYYDEVRIGATREEVDVRLK